MSNIYCNKLLKVRRILNIKRKLKIDSGWVNSNGQSGNVHLTQKINSLKVLKSLFGQTLPATVSSIIRILFKNI